MERLDRIWPRVAVSFLLLAAGSAFADDVQGLVRVTGNPLETKVFLTPETEFTGPALCPNDQAALIKTLDAMVVKATGTWQQASGQAKCLQTTSFTVLKTPAGRPAMVGVLSEKSGIYTFKRDDGTVLPVSDPAADLRKLTGKKIILDLKVQGEGHALTDGPNKAVFFTGFPE